MADTQTLLQNVENSMIEFLKETAINKVMDKYSQQYRKRLKKNMVFYQKYTK